MDNKTTVEQNSNKTVGRLKEMVCKNIDCTAYNFTQRTVMIESLHNKTNYYCRTCGNIISSIEKVECDCCHDIILKNFAVKGYDEYHNSCYFCQHCDNIRKGFTDAF